jgi:hypothetical protein
VRERMGGGRERREGDGDPPRTHKYIQGYTRIRWRSARREGGRSIKGGRKGEEAGRQGAGRKKGIEGRMKKEEREERKREFSEGVPGWPGAPTCQFF